MHHPAPNDRVRLTEDVPTLWLQRGEIGVVVGVEIAADAAYEVEFHKACNGETLRALLFAGQVEVVAPPGHGLRSGERHG